MVQSGLDPMMFEDFADVTFDLLREVREALHTGNVENVLLDAFNNEMLQNCIIAHLRVSHTIDIYILNPLTI